MEWNLRVCLGCSCSTGEVPTLPPPKNNKGNARKYTQKPSTLFNSWGSIFLFSFVLVCVCVLHSFCIWICSLLRATSLLPVKIWFLDSPWVQTCVPWPKRPLFTDGPSVPTTIRYMRTPSMWKIRTTKHRWIRSVTLHGLSLQKIRCGICWYTENKECVIWGLVSTTDWDYKLSIRGFSRSRLLLRISSHGRSTDVIGCWGDCDAQFRHTIFFCMAGFAGGTCCYSSASNGETWSSKNCLRVVFGGGHTW